jgi:hypothetical protein
MITDKEKLAKSIPQSKRKKSTWCKGFVIPKPLSEIDRYAIEQRVRCAKAGRTGRVPKYF